jgi:hypothetical protein
MLLYLGSSQLTGPNEMELIRRWAEALRASDDATIRACGILVRPHPALRASWTSVDLSHLGNIAISLDASRGADQELFDSLHHAHAAVVSIPAPCLKRQSLDVRCTRCSFPASTKGRPGQCISTILWKRTAGLRPSRAILPSITASSRRSYNSRP